MENEKMIVQLQQLLALIQQDPAIQAFQEIERQLDDYPELQPFMKKMKHFQQLSVQAEAYGQEKLTAVAGQQSEELRAEFFAHPFVKEYQEKLGEANELIQHIANFLEEEVAKRVEY